MWITAILLAVLLITDQVSKYFAVEMGSNTIEWGNFLQIHLKYNKGAAFSLFDNFPWGLVIISAVASIILGYIAMKNDWKHGKFGAIGVTMAFAGAVGNVNASPGAAVIFKSVNSFVPSKNLTVFVPLGAVISTVTVSDNVPHVKVIVVVPTFKPFNVEPS